MAIRCVCGKPFRRECELANHRTTCTKHQDQASPAAASSQARRVAPRTADEQSPLQSLAAAPAAISDNAAAGVEPEPLADDGDAGEQPEHFDSCGRFVEVMVDLKMSAAEVRQLLDLLHDPRFNVAELPRTTHAFKAYMADLVARNSNTWLETVIDLGPDWPVEHPIVFRHRDGAAWLQERLCDTGLREDFTFFAAAEHDQDGQRIYSTPANTDAWLAQQVHVRQAHGRGSYVVGLQLYSDKTNLTTRVSAYPIKMAILNLRHKVKVKHIVTLGYVPTLADNPSLGAEQFRTAKRTLLHKCVHVALAPLKQASHSGISCQQPDLSVRLAVPRLLSYVADDPEQRAIAGIYVACSCQRQCCTCFCTSDQLGDPDVVFAPRTLTSMRAIRAAISAADTQQAKELQADWSVHPEETALAGFAGEDMLTADPHQVMGFEYMHNIDLGLVQLLIKVAGAYAEQVGFPKGAKRVGHATRLFKVLDQRLQEVPRYEGFYLPRCGKYFSNDAVNYQAKQHRAVIQVLPSLVRGLLDKKLEHIVCSGSYLCMLMYTRNRQLVFTEASLQEVDMEVGQLLKNISLTTPTVNINTPKPHKLTHFTEDVRRHGHPEHNNSDKFETDHIPCKEEYRHGSKKLQRDQFLMEMVFRRQVAEAIAAEQELRQCVAASANGVSISSSISRPDGAFATAYITAADTSEHALSSSSQTVSLSVLSVGAPQPRAEGLPPQAEARTTRSLRWREADAGMHLLPRRLQEHLLAQSGSSLSSSLPELVQDTIHVHTHAVLAAECAWASDLLLQTVRAHHSFHGRPFYDAVEVKVPTSRRGTRQEGEQTALHYAQLLLLFEYECFHVSSSSSGQPQSAAAAAAAAAAGSSSAAPERRRGKLALAYVRWLRPVAGSSTDPLVKRGAVLLEARKTPAAAAADDGDCYEYGVIRLSSIVRRVHVMRDYGQDSEDRYHTNPFKY